mmetsp:Transcript_2768/g.3939  ORF Transcript_2768/g.3939 Transcript_2768/m.3939 type:complete len:94 (-) Transcript_2768:715-996(-)
MGKCTIILLQGDSYLQTITLSLNFREQMRGSPFDWNLAVATSPLVFQFWNPFCKENTPAEEGDDMSSRNTWHHTNSKLPMRFLRPPKWNNYCI